LMLIGIVFLSGCIGQQSKNITQESTSTTIEEGPIIFGPVDYALSWIPVNITHEMMYGRVRWNSSTITFYSEIRENYTLQFIRDAVDTWNKKTVIKFVEVDKPEEADFIVRYPKLNEFNWTETIRYLGEAQIYLIDTGLFNLSTRGEMLYLTTNEECKSRATALHELGHIVGLAHSSDAKDIMFTFAECDRSITDEIKQTLANIYSIEALPDLYFGNVKVEKVGKILNLNITILNRGLVASKNVSIEVKANDDIIESYDLQSMEPAVTAIIQHEIPTTKNFDSVSITIDPLHVQDELDRENNLMILRPL